MHYYSSECMLIHKVRASSHSHKVRLQHIDSLMQRYIFCSTRRFGYNITHLFLCVMRGCCYDRHTITHIICNLAFVHFSYFTQYTVLYN